MGFSQAKIGQWVAIPFASESPARVSPVASPPGEAPLASDVLSEVIFREVRDPVM